jgi:hypothetical protein
MWQPVLLAKADRLGQKVRLKTLPGGGEDRLGGRSFTGDPAD